MVEDRLEEGVGILIGLEKWESIAVDKLTGFKTLKSVVFET